MGSFGTSDSGGGGPKFKGYMMVGPPWEVRKEFYKPTFDGANGRVTSVIAGKIHSVLDEPVYNYSRTEKFNAPADAVGHQVSFFVNHPVANHSVGDGYDDYRYLDTKWGTFGRPWPNYTLEMLLGKVGASTRGLHTKDDEELLKQILALLNTGDPFPIAVWDSKRGDIEYQVPAGTEVLAQFYRFLYWDFERKRPTWATYEATGRNENGEERTYTFRDVSFLLRIVAPAPWAGTILRMPVNYTIKRSEDDDGNPAWWHHTKAIFKDVMKTLGVKAESWVKDVDEELLMEVEVGEPANWLGPLEEALQEMANRRLLHITIPKKPLKYRDVLPADTMVIERIMGQTSFTPPPLRSIKDLTAEEIEVATQGAEDEEIPGFDGLGMTELTAMNEINRIASVKIWTQPNTRPTKEGIAYAQMYLLSAFKILDVPRDNPLEGGGWTKAKMKKLETLLQNDDFRAACESIAGEDKEAAVEFGRNLLSTPEEPSGAGF